MISAKVKAVVEALRSKGKLGRQEFMSGSNLMYSCPFKKNHGGQDQKTPAFGIQEESGMWNCFSCGEGSQDIVDLYTRLMQTSRFEAKQNLGNLEVSVDQLQEQLDALGGPMDDKAWAMAPYAEGVAIEPGSIAAEYLESRNIPQAVWEAAGLTYYAEERLPPPDPSVYGMSGKRIIFPIHQDGKLLGYSGRTLNQAEKVKYYRPIRNVRALVYNPLQLDNSNADFVFIVEGELDCLSCLREGLPAVSILGSNLSKQHRTFLAQFRKVYMMLDGDKAGENGTADAIHTHGVFLNLTHIPLAPGMDPGAMEVGWAEKMVGQLRSSFGDKTLDFVSGAVHA